MKKHFETCDNKGFHITFDNGLTLSTQIGAANYCDNYNQPFDSEKPRRSWKSDLCEVAIWTPDGNWITEKYTKKSGSDCIIGYVKFDEWLNIFEWCKNYKVENGPALSRAEAEK